MEHKMACEHQTSSPLRKIPIKYMNYDFIYNRLFQSQQLEILQLGIFMTYLKLGKRLFTI